MNNQLQKTKSYITLSLAMLTLLFSVSVNAATYTVSNLNDSGAGSLRQAILDANGTADNDVIEFSVNGTITLTSGELLIDNNGTLTINGPTNGTGVIVSGNNASRGFNINVSAIAEINYLTVSNCSGVIGGGIINQGTLTLNSSTISNNDALIGAGIFNSGTLTLNNSTVSGNTNGSAINNQGPLTINNSTISDNVSGVTNSSPTVTFLNTIIANHTGFDCLDTTGPINATYTLIESGLGCILGTNINNLTGDPNLGPLQNNGGPTQTHALLPGSIARDAADPVNFPPFDQRGFVRPADGNPLSSGLLSKNYRKNLLALAPDMGAFEALAPTSAPASISGRVMTSSSRAIARATVQVTDMNGDILTTRTNHFGYYTFEDIEVGQTLIFNVYSRRYQFAPQIVNLEENLTDLNFIAEGQGQRTKATRKMRK